MFLNKRQAAAAQWSRNSPMARIKHSKEGLPVWWCPWIHDLGLMAGCVRHGFMNVNAMRNDTSLPFHPAAALEHISRTLLRGDPRSTERGDRGDSATSHGGNTCGGSGDGVLAVNPKGAFKADAEGVREWAEEVSTQFPSRRAAEDRVFRICMGLTKLMPLSHPIRVRCYNERWG
ncbi:unnamed protein product [Choristocarpus tenellus]